MPWTSCARTGTCSRPTRPTTSTSASAASTSVSTCSAPTTTATSAGSRRWPPAPATTRTTTSTYSPLTLDIEVITRQANDNPVYYVQYAHARIASLLRHAADLGITRAGTYDPGLLAHEREGDLIKALGKYPEIVATAAELREPHRIARYLEELAGTYHRFYDACRVLPQVVTTGDTVPASDLTLTNARLWLVEAARIVFANGLALLGVSAPERM